jgi:hypothetical protein
MAQALKTGREGGTMASMIDLERICREAGGRLTRLATGHGQSAEAWVFELTDYHDKPTHAIARIVNVVLEEAAKAAEGVYVLSDDEPTGRGYLDDAARAVRALRLPE